MDQIKKYIRSEILLTWDIQQKKLLWILKGLRFEMKLKLHPTKTAEGVKNLKSIITVEQLVDTGETKLKRK